MQPTMVSYYDNTALAGTGTLSLVLTQDCTKDTVGCIRTIDKIIWHVMVRVRDLTPQKPQDKNSEFSQAS